MSGYTFGRHFKQRFALNRFTFGQLRRNGRTASCCNDRLLLLVQTIPNLFVYEKFLNGRLLVPSREVVMLGQVVKTEVLIDGGHRKLGRIDRSAFESRVDIPTSEKLRIDTHFLHHQSAKPVETHLQPSEIFSRIDLFLEPAGGFRRYDTANLPVDSGRMIDFIHQFFAVAVPHPG